MFYPRMGYKKCISARCYVLLATGKNMLHSFCKVVARVIKNLYKYKIGTMKNPSQVQKFFQNKIKNLIVQ